MSILEVSGLTPQQQPTAVWASAVLQALARDEDAGRRPNDSPSPSSPPGTASAADSTPPISSPCSSRTPPSSTPYPSTPAPSADRSTSNACPPPWQSASACCSPSTKTWRTPASRSPTVWACSTAPGVFFPTRLGRTRKRRPSQAGASDRHYLPTAGGFPDVKQEIWNLPIVSPIPTTGRSVDGAQLLVKLFRNPREDVKRTAVPRSQALNEITDVLVRNVINFGEMGSDDDDFLTHLLFDEESPDLVELALYLP